MNRDASWRVHRRVPWSSVRFATEGHASDRFALRAGSASAQADDHCVCAAHARRTLAPLACARGSSRGFTLLELIIVVGILMILIALVVPSLRSGAAAGRGVACASNLRQMSVAAMQYAMEYRHFPPAVRSEMRDGVFTVIAWDWVTLPDGTTVGPGPLWWFTDDPHRVQQCPEYGGDANFTGDPFTGYNYNTTYIGGEASVAVPGWATFRSGVPLSQCRRATTCAIFGCGGFAGGANKFMRAPLNSVEGNLSVVYAGGQAFRHSGGCNVAFIDGHSERRTTPYAGEKATDDLLRGTMEYPRNGFLSNDDAAYDPR